MKINKFIKKNKITISFTFLLFAFSLFCLLFLVRDSDYFWHIKVGEYIFNSGILKSDIFSWYLHGKYWMSHEWLFEFIIYLFKYLFGSYHMLIYGFICISSLLLILFFSNKKGYLKNIPFTLLWIIIFIFFIGSIQVRPHLFSFSLLALVIWFLYDLLINENSKKIYFLPLITIFWANFHGGSSNLGYIFCFIFFFIGLFDFEFCKIKSIKLSRKQLIKYFVVGLICMISVCLNVHGFKMFIYPYQNMADSVMLSNIFEWQPTNLNIGYHYLYFILLLIIVITMLVSKKKILLIDLVLLSVSMYLGLKSIRFWPYTYIIMSYVIFNYINTRREDKGTELCICLIGITFIFLFFIGSSILNKNINMRYLNDDVIDIIKKESPKRLFNMYDYGGELIYNDIDVFIDGRADLYSKYNYNDYLNISLLKYDYVKTIDRYNFDYFLVNNKYSINTYLKYNDNYSVIYKNKNFSLYKKNS